MPEVLLLLPLAKRNWSFSPFWGIGRPLSSYVLEGNVIDRFEAMPITWSFFFILKKLPSRYYLSVYPTDLTFLTQITLPAMSTEGAADQVANSYMHFCSGAS